jgi:prepilin-type N-terminal cleavage/methylation domain-containing protein
MRSFTLIELVIVIIIIGILATLATTQYGGAREKAVDKEAISNLKLIQSAEKIYRMESNNNTYYPPAGSANTTDINTNLKLSLSAGTNRYWDYTAYANGTGAATRYPGASRTWTLPIDAENATCTGTCY